MGIIAKLFKNFKCQSSCSLNAEEKQMEIYRKQLSNEEIREVKEYFEAKAKILDQKKEEIKKKAIQSIAV